MGKPQVLVPFLRPMFRMVASVGVGPQPGQCWHAGHCTHALGHQRRGNSSTDLNGVTRFQLENGLKQPSFVKKELALLVSLSSTTLYKCFRN